jgi:membrane associated rhomboid family serine protease
MIAFRKSDDFEPVAWVRGYPLYFSALLVGLHLLALVAWALVFAFHHGGWITWVAFSSDAVLQNGRIWQWVTYLFVHNPTDPIGFAIEMFLLYAFGREVERYLGRRSFITLYAALAVAPAALLTVAGLFAPRLLVGSHSVHLAVFLAFATLYPRVELFFRIQVRWIAGILLAMYTLGNLASNQWTALGVLWVDAGLAVGFVGWQRGMLPRFALPGPQPLSRPAVPPRKPAFPAQEDPMAAIDPLLDKIARHGLSSLTTRERDKLERARKALLEKGA